MNHKESAAAVVAKNKDKIINTWIQRVRSCLPPAQGELRSLIVDTLPEFLNNVELALSPDDPKEYASQDSTIASAHGRMRANLSAYTLSQVIEEYRILREVLFEILEKENNLSSHERHIVHKSIDQAIAEASTAFTSVYSEMRAQFVAILTHDLRSPLSAVKTAAQMILRYHDKIDKIPLFATRIVDSANRMDRMIQDLLDSSRLRAGEPLTRQIEECDLTALLKDVVEELTMAHESTRITVNFGAGPIQGVWDCGLIRRAVMNLLTNAIKYGDQHRSITLQTSASYGRVRISVHNWGHPISAQEQNTLFQAYRRTSATNQGPKRGWGLGLALVKGVAEAHGGVVIIESTAEAGTTFILDILLDASQLPPHNSRTFKESDDPRTT